MSYKMILTQRWPSKAPGSKDRQISTQAQKSGRLQGQWIRLASNASKQHQLHRTHGHAYQVLWGCDSSHGCNTRAKPPKGSPWIALDVEEVRELGTGYLLLEKLLSDEIQWSKRWIKINDSGMETLLKKTEMSQDEMNDGEKQRDRWLILTPTM